MRVLKLILLLNAGWLLPTGCAHSYRERIDQELGGWLGKEADQLVQAWGAPRSTYTMDKGVKVLTYENTSFVSRSTSPYYFYPRPEVYSYSDSCKISFFTDANQKLLSSYSYSGSPGVCYDLIENGNLMRRSAPLTPAPTQAPAAVPGA